MPSEPATDVLFEVSSRWRTCPLPVKYDSDIATRKAALPSDRMLGLRTGDRVALRAVGAKVPHEFEVISTDLPGALLLSKDDFDGMGLDDGANTVQIRRFRPRLDGARKLVDLTVVGYALGIVVALLAFVAATWFPAPEKGVDPATVRSTADELADRLEIEDAADTLDASVTSLESASERNLATFTVDPDGDGPQPATDVVDARDVAAVQELLAVVADDVSAARGSIDEDVTTARSEVDELEAAVTVAEREGGEDRRRYEAFRLVQQIAAVLIAVVLTVLAVRNALRSRLGV